jgi:haloalkane dehalogenase
VIETGDRFPRRRVRTLDSFLATIDLDDGPEPPLLFLHGNPTHAYLWRNIIPHVRGSRRIVAPDLIGMGASGKPPIDYRFFDHARYLEAFLDELALDRVVLVGHDWGAALALDWWARHPDRVRGIALSEGVIAAFPSWDDFPAGGRTTFRQYRTSEVGEALILDGNRFIEHSLPAAILRPLSPIELDAYRAPFTERAHRRPLLAWPRELPIAGEPADVVARIETCRALLCRSPIPKLLLTAEPGALVRAPLIAWCRARLPALEEVPVGRAVHYPQEDQPEAFGGALRDWLARCCA